VAGRTGARCPEAGHAYERWNGAAAAALPVGYRPRAPEKTPLHVAVRRGLAPFLEQTSRQGGLHGFVVRELEAYLGCGVLANG
jgi:hypothetical protein